MKKLGAALLLYLGLASAALAQTTFTMPPPAGVFVMGMQVVTTCGSASLANNNIAYATMDVTGTICTGTGGGGGGGLSITDQAAWTQGSSKFTPGGGVFNDTATLSSGQEGSLRLTTKRAQIVDVDSSGNQLHSDLTAPIPDCGATPCTNKIGVVGVNTWAAGVLGAMANFSTSPGAVLVPGVNASQFQGTTAVVAEPCQTNAKTRTTINFTASGLQTTPIVAGVSAKKTYVCQIIVNNAVADNVAVFAATTGTSCGTPTNGLYGGTTAATGMNLAVNSGWVDGNGGYAVNFTSTNNDDICMTHSASGQVSGKILTVQQ